MSLLSRFFAARDPRDRLRPLYDAVVAEARAPHWYRDGGVPDTTEGRFEMVAAILSLILLRLEAEGEAMRRESVLLTELFVADMDGHLRQIGIGDVVVGKHVGRLMGALGGRLGALRSGLAGGSVEDAVRRNLFRDAPPSGAAVDYVSNHLRALHQRLAGAALGPILEGQLPS